MSIAPVVGPVKKLEELQKMFKRGVSLDQFRTLYPQYKKGVEVHKEFRRIDEAIQFLEDNGGYDYPEPKLGAWITEGRAWVAAEGYLPLHKYPLDWFAGQVQFKYLVNVIGLNTRVLIFDYATAKVWDYVAANPVSYDKALHWTLLIRPLVGDNPTYADIIRARNSLQGVEPGHAVMNGRLGIIQESTHIPSLRSILSGEWVPTPRKLVWFDGMNHLLLLPAWIMNRDLNYAVTDWVYFL